MVSFCKFPGHMKLPGSHIWKISPTKLNSHESPFSRNLVATKVWFGSCQTRAWQLPNSALAVAKRGSGSNRKTNHTK